MIDKQPPRIHPVSEIWWGWRHYSEVYDVADLKLSRHLVQIYQHKPYGMWVINQPFAHGPEYVPVTWCLMTRCEEPNVDGYEGMIIVGKI